MEPTPTLSTAALGKRRTRQDTGAPQDHDDVTVVRFVNTVLINAIRHGASDIHFEPYEHHYRVRYRQDGILHPVDNAPLALTERITARLKVLAGLNIAERRIPQDGRITLRLSPTRAINLRVNSCPHYSARKSCCVFWTRPAPGTVSTHWAANRSNRPS